MKTQFDRRQFLRLAGYGGIVFASGLTGFSTIAEAASSTGKPAKTEDFFFVQLSDTHWGFTGPAVNPDAEGTLKKAIAEVNALPQQPDFIVFTGDLTQTTDDDAVRRQRMKEFREIVSGLRVQDIRFLPGEHDASLDGGATYKDFFGELHYSFDHKGVHFIALDNVSDARAILGDAQIEWLAADLKGRDKSAPIVVLTHRPLFDLAPSWDWATRDGDKAIALLEPFDHVTVFYGHIHQENHHMTGNIAHHSADSLMWPLPAPLSVPKKGPIPWDAAAPYRGLGFRQIQSDAKNIQFPFTEIGIKAG